MGHSVYGLSGSILNILKYTYLALGVYVSWYVTCIKNKMCLDIDGFDFRGKKNKFSLKTIWKTHN